MRTSRARRDADGRAARRRDRQCASRRTCRAPSRSIRTGGASCRSTLEAAGEPTSAFPRSPRRSRRSVRRRPRGRARAVAPRQRAFRARPTACSCIARLHISRRDRARAVPRARSASATFTARRICARARGSTHGYDIIDHNALNPEIGSARGLRALVRGAARARHGPDARHRAEPHGRAGRRQRVVARRARKRPGFGVCGFLRHRLAAGERDADATGAAAGARRPVRRGARARRAQARVRRREPASFGVRYYDHRFPIDPREYPRILDARSMPRRAPTAQRRSRRSRRSAGCVRRPAARATTRRRERSAERDAAQGRVQAAARAPRRGATPASRAAIEQRGARLTARRRARELRALHELLERRRIGSPTGASRRDEINYRRFFDINDLAALRMENEAVFEATHRFVLDSPRQARSTGCASTIPTACSIPPQYFRRLQAALSHARAGRRRAPRTASAAAVRGRREDRRRARGPAETWAGARHDRLSLRERRQRPVRRHRPPSALRPRSTAASPARRGVRRDRATRASALIMRTALASRAHGARDRARCASRAPTADTRDFTFNTLRHALAEVIACFPGYRTYIVDDAVGAGPALHRVGGRAGAATQPRRGRRAFSTSSHACCSPSARAGRAAGAAGAHAHVRARFQQFTAPVMAKGVEDTAFYRYNRLVSLNDVGGDPAHVRHLR